MPTEVDLVVKLIDLGKDFVGFKAAGTEVEHLSYYRDDSDWSGFYVAKSEDHARCYLANACKDADGKDNPNKSVALWQIKIRGEVKVLCVEGEYLSDPTESSKNKAKAIKKLLQDAHLKDKDIPKFDFKDEDLLIRKIGDAGLAYMGADSESDQEIIIPWSLLLKRKDLIEVAKVAEVPMRNYSPDPKKKEIPITPLSFSFLQIDLPKISPNTVASYPTLITCPEPSFLKRSKTI